MGIGVAHGLVRRLGGGIERQRRVDLCGFCEGQGGIGPIDRRGRGHKQMADLAGARHFYRVECADQVGTDVGGRVA